MENTINTEISRFIAKYEQQENTATQCGFENYCEMSVMHWINEYTVLADIARQFPYCTRIALY